MGKRTLITGIVVGASIGGLISLFNEDARKYAKSSLTKSCENLSHYAKNPAEAVSTVRQTVLSLNEAVENNTESAVNALEQVENSLNKVMKK